MKNIPIRVVTEDQAEKHKAESIARQWLADSAATATARDFSAHMNLISKKVVVRGVPEHDAVGYDDWHRQCQHEFTEGILEAVSYEGFKLVAHRDDRIMFKTIECIKAKGANLMRQGIEVVLDHEEDGLWRVIQERILSPEEVAHDGIV